MEQQRNSIELKCSCDARGDERGNGGGDSDDDGDDDIDCDDADDDNENDQDGYSIGNQAVVLHHPSESPLQNMLDCPPETPASAAITPDEEGKT